MTEDDVLFRAVLHAPADDAPRLVYADWLEKHGQVERAEFIRVQIELDRLPHKGGHGGAALRQRERALLKAHEADWRSAFPAHPAIRWGPFERGFVGSVAVYPVEEEQFAARKVRRLLAQLAEGCDRAPITRFHFFGPTPANARALGRWPWLARFTSLHLEMDPQSGICIEAIGVRALARSPHLAHLRHLELGGQEIGPEGARALAASPHLGRLTSLGLSENEVGDAGAKALAGSGHLGNLTSLDLTGNEIEDEGAAALAASPHLAGLQVLKLADNDIGTEAARALRKRFGKRVRLDA
jgi:uncharacterized protein (TIGR02996 family)